ncbi:neuropeptide F isoform X2 [Xylocopa sonorina]
MPSCSDTIYLFLVLFALGTVIVRGEPETMARPTRPEVFASPEELRGYADHVIDYYLLKGKARFGKRGNVPSAVDVNHVWDVIRTIQENSQRSQRPRFEKSRYLDEPGSYGVKKDASRIDARPCHVLNIVERYYDDTQ